MNPRHPIYIVSKGRAHNRLTSKALTLLGDPYYIVVEKSEFQRYADQEPDKSRILKLPKRYLKKYDTCDDLGDQKSKGPGAARNFCWDHSMESGNTHHWVMDDNLYDFFRLHNNMKVPVRTGACFRAAEDFVDRYTNVSIAGLNYENFCKATDAVPPVVVNTRVYSCLLIKNSIPQRWRGRYNEDTDICLRVLKNGFCTIQFNAFLCEKTTTQRMSGGNTKEFYKDEGTLPKSEMIEKLHPDVCKVVWKFNRWHHKVNYSIFANNALKKKKGLKVKKGFNNYGMKLIDGILRKNENCVKRRKKNVRFNFRRPK